MLEHSHHFQPCLAYLLGTPAPPVDLVFGPSRGAGSFFGLLDHGVGSFSHGQVCVPCWRRDGWRALGVGALRFLSLFSHFVTYVQLGIFFFHIASRVLWVPETRPGFARLDPYAETACSLTLGCATAAAKICYPLNRLEIWGGPFIALHALGLGLGPEAFASQSANGFEPSRWSKVRGQRYGSVVSSREGGTVLLHGRRANSQAGEVSMRSD